jgi:SAM-dependent methyltransferase
MAAGDVTQRQSCRTCGSKRLVRFLDLGEMPLAGGFLTPAEFAYERRYPLQVYVCENCTLVQIPAAIPPDQLFREYCYLSSVTQTLSEHFREYANFLRQHLLPSGRSFVVEFGSNDGVLLGPLKALGVDVLGVDPAQNIIAVARQKGIETIGDYFTEELARTIAARGRLADVITASNVFAHIDDLDDVMRGVDALLADEGTFVVEAHYIVDLLQTVQFDTIYHEHLCYFSTTALSALLGRHGLTIVDVLRLPMHGGAVRVMARRAGRAAARPSPRVAELAALESRLALGQTDTYLRFGAAAAELRDRLHELVVTRLAAGRRLSGYGAPGRGTILLNYCEIDHRHLDYIVDASPLRAGKWMPGVHVPIVAPTQLAKDPTDDCLMLAWNYRREILDLERAYRARGGVFIVPLPVPEIVA